MERLKRKKKFIFLLLCITLLLSSCQIEKTKKSNKTQKATYRDCFTKEEKTKGTAKFDLMENVTVDAQITPAEKYKDGLKKYYMKHYIEATGLKRKNFADTPVLYGRKLSKIMEMISKQIGGEFTVKKPKADKSELSVGSVFHGNNNLSYKFFAYWTAGDAIFEKSQQLYAPTMYIHLQPGMNDALDQHVDTDILRYVKNYRDVEVPFIKDMEGTGRKLKNYLEKMLGRKLSDTWDCIPVMKESIDMVNNAFKDANISESVKIKHGDEYCTYRYYYDVKGFPFANLHLNYQVKEGENASAMSKMSTNSSNLLSGLSENSIECRISKDGIIDLETDNIRMEGDVYKGAEQVRTPDTILQKVKKYYEKQILTKQITITEINIVYTGYFTDGSEGEIQPTVAPFWRVRVYNNDEDGSKYFVYDAFTGEAIAEGVTAVE